MVRLTEFCDFSIKLDRQHRRLFNVIIKIYITAACSKICSEGPGIFYKVHLIEFLLSAALCIEAFVVTRTLAPIPWASTWGKRLLQSCAAILCSDVSWQQKSLLEATSSLEQL